MLKRENLTGIFLASAERKLNMISGSATSNNVQKSHHENENSFSSSASPAHHDVGVLPTAA